MVQSWYQTFFNEMCLIDLLENELYQNSWKELRIGRFPAGLLFFITFIMLIFFVLNFVLPQDYQVIDKVWIIKDKHGPEAWKPFEEETETIDVGKVSELHVTSVEWLSINTKLFNVLT